MRVALCPGSYDPPTKGHLNIIQRTAQLFDKVIVVVMVNADKNTAFTVEERVNMLHRITEEMPTVEVDAYNGLVAEYAALRGINTLVKGLRAISDYEYEFQMALTNKKLNPGLETIFINTDARYMYLSSSAVKEVARFGGDISEFVPAGIEQDILRRLRKPGKTEQA